MAVKRRGRNLAFCVFGTPVAQPRVSHFLTRAGKHGGAVSRKHPVTAYKEAIGYAALENRPPGWPMGRPMELKLLFIFKAPDGVKDGTPHTSKPDADNLAKAVKDALNGVLWNDDCQVSILYAEKRYESDNPGVTISVTARED